MITGFLNGRSSITGLWVGAGRIEGPAFQLRRYCSTDAAVPNSRASWPGAAVSCNPRGSPLEIGIGIEIAGVPNAVHGLFIRVSPVNAKPNGAGPTAAGERMTGVISNNSVNRALHESIYRTVV